MSLRASIHDRLTRLTTRTGSPLLAILSLIAVGVGTALAQTAAPQTAQPSGELETKLNEVVKEFAREPRFKNMTEQQVRDRIEFVAGNVIFATVHEVGHMLVTEMGLPVLGREEDAVDAFAVLTGLKLAGGLSDRILTQSARGWFMSDQRNQKQKVKMVFYDEHGRTGGAAFERHSLSRAGIRKPNPRGLRRVRRPARDAARDGTPDRPRAHRR